MPGINWNCSRESEIMTVGQLRGRTNRKLVPNYGDAAQLPGSAVDRR